ncbi:tRNA 1-methyladenosine methyltransferase subunit GCD10 [Ascoidea rubescens DSM 1968]|uniref:tRNA (adenine(58)-N(1))-methyltransferase non-catalytic subunit TRM6 n=1 Tax=Ascoidea rubescens DSM 1968 TaxID=1344418 RepID=A0A1D2VD61_9ASCO|nr:adenine-N(1)--methyltransferase [Ascoidea rubescens DSM 1968]ODV59433.1 adenine-N(1)--methyltransferase [Ascoidea rubescens DSM 1968]
MNEEFVLETKGKNRLIISPNQYCFIKLPSSGIKIVQLRPDGVISLGKFGCFEVNSVLNHPYGETFEIIENKQARAIYTDAFEAGNDDEDLEEENISEAEISSKLLSTDKENKSRLDNRDVNDIGSGVQKLTSVEIELLKKDSELSNKGKGIIEKLIESHTNFNKKTVHSQEKYVKRKQQKFLKVFTIEYLSASNLLRFYTSKDFGKIHELSEESLGLMISLADVRPGGRYLVVDECLGLIVYTMMERMNLQGEIVLIHENEHANLISLKYSDYSEEEIKKFVKTINWLQFFEPDNEKIKFPIKSETEISLLTAQKRSNYYRHKRNAEITNSVIDNVKRGQFDGLIMASTLYLPKLLPKIVDKIGGSRAIVCYSNNKELLNETNHVLLNDVRVINSKILETRVRPYQSIPGKLHPLMTIRSGGGYLLWGLRVIPGDKIKATGRGNKKSKDIKEKEAEKQEEKKVKDAKIEGKDDLERELKKPKIE